jgi:MarR family transcriptional regulator, organic hydroperoxide resistance regulator
MLASVLRVASELRVFYFSICSAHKAVRATERNLVTSMPHTNRAATEAARPADLPDVLQFMQLLWAVVHGLERVSKRMTGDIGVTGPQRLVLRVVGLFPGMSAGDLASVLHVHPSTLTGVLQRLVGQRLLARSDDPDDRRRAVLRLTKRGARINAARHGTVEAAIAQALEDVSDRDRIATRRVLERLATHLAPADGPASERRRRARAQGRKE